MAVQSDVGRHGDLSLIDTEDRLRSPKLDELLQLIRDSFRVRLNRPPVYVDVGGNLERLAAPQHQVVFGRRGSGKSCLLVHYLESSSDGGLKPVYILADEFKRLTYPDVLIRLLIELLQGVPTKGSWWKRFLGIPRPTEKYAKQLRDLLDLAEEADVTEGQRSARTSDFEGAGEVGGARMRARDGVSEERSRSSSFRERKIDTLERHLRDYKLALQASLKGWGCDSLAVLVDDFYLFPRDRQPDIVDYLHRLVRDTNLYLKVATIRHRTSLLRNNPQTVGVELGQDVEELSLDRTLENLEATQDFLADMLRRLAEKAGVAEIDGCFNPNAMQALTLVSGGVPRDFLNIFVNAVDAARTVNRMRWLTPTTVYKGAGRLSYKQKLTNLREDAGVDVAGLERVFVDLLRFCLRETRKTAFLVSQEEAQSSRREHDLIHQLMDFKLVHVVEPDTSAASGRPGRYEAYTLDFALFTEPRRRGIEIVEFWKVDESFRRIGLRESPVYPLERVKSVFEDSARTDNPEDAIEQIPAEETDEVEGDAQPADAADA